MAEPLNGPPTAALILLSDGEASCILPSTAHSVNDGGAGLTRLTGEH